MNRWPGNFEGLVQMPRLGKSGNTAGGSGTVQSQFTTPGQVPGIVGYFNGMIPANDHSSELPAWDGKWPVIVNSIPNTYDGFLFQGSHSIDSEQVCTCQLFFDTVDTWKIRIGADNDFGSLWVGTLVSPSFSGVYTFVSGNSPAPPGTLTLAILPGSVQHANRIFCAT